MGGFLSWWDGVELWLSGLGFVVQTIVVMPVVLLLAYLIAVLLDSLLGRGIRLMRSARPGSAGADKDVDPAAPRAVAPGAPEGPR